MNIFYRFFLKWFSNPALPPAKPIRFILSLEQSDMLHGILESLNIDITDATLRAPYHSQKNCFYRFIHYIFLEIKKKFLYIQQKLFHKKKLRKLDFKVFLQ